MKTIGYITTFIIIAVPTTIWNGYVLSILWGWFIVPTFEAPTLSVGYAIGFTMIVSYLTHPINLFKKDNKEWKNWFIEIASLGALKPAIALFSAGL